MSEEREQLEPFVDRGMDINAARYDYRVGQSFTVKPISESIASFQLAMDHLGKSLIPSLVAVRQGLQRIARENAPLLERIRREVRRQERIKKAELKAARKVRRRKPQLWAGETSDQ